MPVSGTGSGCPGNAGASRHGLVRLRLQSRGRIIEADLTSLRVSLIAAPGVPCLIKRSVLGDNHSHAGCSVAAEAVIAHPAVALRSERRIRWDRDSDATLGPSRRKPRSHIQLCPVRSSVACSGMLTGTHCRAPAPKADQARGAVCGAAASTGATALGGSGTFGPRRVPALPVGLKAAQRRLERAWHGTGSRCRFWLRPRSSQPGWERPEHREIPRFRSGARMRRPARGPNPSPRPTRTTRPERP